MCVCVVLGSNKTVGDKYAAFLGLNGLHWKILDEYLGGTICRTREPLQPYRYLSPGT